MIEVKFVYTGYVNIEDTEDDVMEAAIEHVRDECGSQIADYADFTIMGEDENNE
jgi:hypothetical protein